MTYAILLHPGHNRVYFETAKALALAEFAIAAPWISAGCGAPRQTGIAGIDYLLFETRKPLADADIRLISQLSFAYALFWLEDEATPCLHPLARQSEAFVDEGIGAMLKYTGKTNETFTRMLINIACWSRSGVNKGAANPPSGLSLFDPVAGKGTTLFEGLAKGCNVYGVEIGEKVTTEAWHFLKRFLETARYKFEIHSQKISGPGKRFTATRHCFETAKTKEDFKAGHRKTAEFICGNSAYADQYYKRNSFDILVGDLPYGVQHGNVTNEGQSALTRSPAQLLDTCLPAWRAVLKPGGAMALSWNSRVLPRGEMEALLEKHGLVPKREEPYLQLAHRVDQAITRDVVVAGKT